MSTPRTFITGDTHGRLQRISDFAQKQNLSTDDVVVILGDVGVNFQVNTSVILGTDYVAEDNELYQDIDGNELTYDEAGPDISFIAAPGNDLGRKCDEEYKRVVNGVKADILCIHGNHEQRPATLPFYHEETWRGGTVYVEEKFTHLKFAKDGEIYNLPEGRALVIGGAYSVDKAARRPFFDWWPDEQPSPAIRKRVENTCEKNNWKVDFVFSHTCPARFTPYDKIVDGISPEDIDRHTEYWLDTIEAQLDYRYWYCGHFHIENVIDKVHFLFEEWEMLPISD